MKGSEHYYITIVKYQDFYTTDIVKVGRLTNAEPARRERRDLFLEQPS